METTIKLNKGNKMKTDEKILDNKIKKYFIEARYVFKLSPIWMRRKH